jgi:hypothetical protein
MNQGGTGQADKKSVSDGLGRWQQRRNEHFETGLWTGYFCDVWGLELPFSCLPRETGCLLFLVEKSRRPNTQGNVLFAHRDSWSSTGFALCWGVRWMWLGGRMTPTLSLPLDF